ncbi:hypothetical protein Cni_G22206 [Canna indica]|uniref:Glycosyltransferase family 92 protein n=1 Tax=Canna indica TaxID=4628 RepID=A0AAQ3KWC6_9LILI|nr:hypothetical protein Cni_G22206 [Canna indica]
MRRKLTTSLLFIAIFVFLAASFSYHIFRDILPSAVSSPSPPPPPLTSRSAALNQPIDRLANNAVRELLGSLPRHQSPLPLDSILLPDWEVLLLLPPNASSSADAASLSCLFHSGANSPARTAGPSAFRCTLPNRLRRVRPFYTPRLIGPSDAVSPLVGLEDPAPREMIRWSGRIAYESFSTDDDVIVFAKGINRRKDFNLPAAGIQCIFSPASGGAAIAATPATTSAQEVFRCPHPPAAEVSRTGSVRVSLSIGPDEAPIPTVANYELPRHGKASRERFRICSCTMVFNVAKFLPEWVAYHAGVGIEQFILYDNGSEDGLDSVVSQLVSEGFNMETRSWPWPKTQEAGFSHCAAENRDECEWMAFLDVDEFVLAPAWTGSDRPDRSMISSLISVPPEVGQVAIRCLDFGPSGQRVHPRGGATQGYTCRRRIDERHKSFVRLDAVGYSLTNSIHHFELGDEFKTRWKNVREARVNHYKYQAWDEFKVKFRRRVSTYVADWRESTNLGSKDRTPGLGSEPIEPRGWAGKFCEVNDTLIRDTTRRWFGTVGPSGEYQMIWQN